MNDKIIYAHGYSGHGLALSILAGKLIAEKITIEWGCETRLDSLDRKLLKTCYDSGLRSVNIGIESEDDDILKANKRKGIIKS